MTARLALDAALRQALAEHVCLERLLAELGAVRLVRLAELLLRDVAVHDAPLGQERAEDVLVLAVLGGRARDRSRFAEPLLLPLKASANRPRKYAGQLGLELLGERPVLAPLERLFEREQSEAAPDRVVVAVDLGTVIRDEHELELGAELEVLAV